MVLVWPLLLLCAHPLHSHCVPNYHQQIGAGFGEAESVCTTFCVDFFRIIRPVYIGRKETVENRFLHERTQEFRHAIFFKLVQFGKVGMFRVLVSYEELVLRITKFGNKNFSQLE